MEKRKETTQKMEAVTKKLIRHSFLESVEKWPPECIVKELGKKIGVVVYCKKEHQQTVRDFIAQMNRTVPLYKRIGVVEFSETPLPRNGAGKLVRK